jgi:ketosteroid isomerase-like protein
MPSDVEILTKLNHDYVMSVRNADTKRFDEILAPDFLCTNPDASLLDRAQFIALIDKGARITELSEDQVNVRKIGDDFAIIHARIKYKSRAGVDRIGRYTDDWARRDGKWLCVSAHTAGEDF